MGGLGSGVGPKLGAGRKRKDADKKWLEGSGKPPADKPAAPAKPPALIVAPADLPEAETAIWNELAPHACVLRTLTTQTVQAFRDLCEAVVLKRKMHAQIEKDGLTYIAVTVDGSGQEREALKAHPLLAQHRGLMQRVEQMMLRFRLSPMGKEIAEDEAPVDPFAEFEDKGSVN